MSDLSILSETMSSSQLANMLNYERKEINKKIRSMFGEKEAREKFSPDLDNQDRVIEYHLPELESKMFVAKHDINYLEQITQYWIDRNKHIQLPTNLVDALRLAADKEEQRLALEQKVANDAPKVKFAESVVSTGKPINIGTYSKVLSNEYGLKIGEKKLFAYLRDQKILMKGRDDTERNLPYKKYLDSGWFVVEHEDIFIGYKMKKVPVTRVTGLGQLELSERIIEHFGKVTA